MLAHLSYYAKAYYTALAGGFLYLASVVGPDLTVADLAHVSLLHWIGFIGIVLGVPLGTAAISNGAKPADTKQAQADAEAAKQASMAAKAVDAPAPIAVSVPVPETSAVTPDPTVIPAPTV